MIACVMVLAWWKKSRGWGANKISEHFGGAKLRSYLGLGRSPIKRPTRSHHKKRAINYLDTQITVNCLEAAH